jgi:hypothetical protein
LWRIHSVWRIQGRISPRRFPFSGFQDVSSTHSWSGYGQLRIRKLLGWIEIYK